MELQEFIKSSLVQIVRGIEDAAEELSDTSAIVSPKLISPFGASFPNSTAIGSYINTVPGRKYVFSIEFDVAVNATTGKESKGSAGIQIASIGIGGHGKSEETTASQTRLKFGVPIVLPNGETIKSRTST